MLRRALAHCLCRALEAASALALIQVSIALYRALG